MNQLEKHFQAEVVRFAKLTGWKVYHTFDSRRSVKGFPDLILLRGDREVVVELKVPGGRKSKEQIEWLQAFSRAGRETFTWMPDEWDEIIEVLT